ncbi:hypothetical protein ACIHFE_32790 [Streptomyces sp. NPDC052396]|uniref:hypothetical protein n=1 Tax=Streptomyces sp. NPDC052396 TaxID=3365689 RepID=UPI0037D5C423
MLIATPTATASEALTCADTEVNSKDFDLPGKKPATEVHAEVCTEKVDGKIHASVGFTWQILDDQALDQGQRWDSFTVTPRLKTRPSKDGTETVAAQMRCDLTKKLNSTLANADAESVTCGLPAQNITPGSLYFADASVTFTIHDGKEGMEKWELTGSPLAIV